MAIQRLSIGKPFDYGGKLYRVYRLQDESLVGYSSLEILEHDPEDGSTLRASGPISMLAAVWEAMPPWLTGDISLRVDASYWPPEYVARRVDNPQHSPQAVLAGDTLLLDTPRGVVVAWSLQAWEEAWRLDLSTTTDLAFLRLLMFSGGLIVCSIFRQQLQEVVYKDLNHLGWDNFPDVWETPMATSTVYLDLAEGHSVQHGIATFGLDGSALHTYIYPQADTKLACGNAEWEERVETRTNTGFSETGLGNSLGITGEGPDNHAQIQAPENSVPRRDYVIEKIQGAATLYDRAEEATASVSVSVQLLTQWDGSQRGVAPAESSSPLRTWRQYSHTVSDSHWQTIINNRQAEEEGYDEAWGGLPGYNPATRQSSAFASTISSALGHPVLGATSDGVGRVAISATQTLYGIFLHPKDAFPVYASGYERSSPWYCCSDGRLLILGPAQDPEHPGDTTWTAIRLEDLTLEWVYSESVTAACSAPVCVGAQIFTLVARPDAPALVVIGLDGAIQAEFDLSAYGPLTEGDLQFQLVSDGAHLFFRAAGKLYSLKL